MIDLNDNYRIIKILIIFESTIIIIVFASFSSSLFNSKSSLIVIHYALLVIRDCFSALTYSVGSVSVLVIAAVVLGASLLLLSMA